MAVLTSTTLLERIKDVTDQHSWDRFYRLYSGLIVGYCRQRCLSNEMAFDVLQETMVRLLRLMPNFHYDPAKGKFRSLLMKIVDSKIKDDLRRQKRYCSLQFDSRDDLVNEIKDSHVPVPGKNWDDLWDKNLLLQAIDRLQQRMEPLPYDSFRLYVLENHSIEQVCKLLEDKYKTKVSKNSIYQHKNRGIHILKLIMEKLKRDVGD